MRSSTDRRGATTSPRGAGSRPTRRQAPKPIRFVARVVAGLLRGNRPMLVLTLLIAVLGLSLLVGPTQRYLEERARVDLLRATDDALAIEVSRLQQRARDLHDPQHIELLAREHHGFVRRGEVAYAIVPPEVDAAMGAHELAGARQPAESGDWWRSWWDRALGWFVGAS